MRTTKSFYEWIKEADQFGEQIIFTINSKSSYKSYTGLIFSCVLLILGVAMFIFMGQSFFFKTNPLTTTSTATSAIPPYFNTSDNRKMFVAFKFTDQSFNDYPGDGTVISFLHQKNSPNQPMALQNRPVPLCSQSAGLDQDYLAKNSLLDNNIYCLPLNSETFGGASTDTNYTNFEILINFCASYSTGCDRARINSYLNSPSLTNYIHFYYPEVFFDPNNPTAPLTVKHSKILDVYTANSYVYREVYFQTTSLLDDGGWVFESIQNTTEITVGDTFSRVYYKPDSTSEILGRYHFFVGTVNQTFTRKYQKIQDVIAIVGGFVKICQTILGLILSNFIKYLRNVELMNGIINWKDDEEIQLPKNMNDRSSLDSKVKKALRLVSSSINHSKPTNPGADDSVQYDKNPKEFKDLSNIQYNVPNASNMNRNESMLLDVSEQTILRLRENNKINNKVSYTGGISYKRSQYDKEELDIYKLKNEIFSKKKKKGRFSFSLSCPELFKKMMCRRFLNEKQKVNVCIYDYAERYLKERLDVFGYLDLVNEVNKIKSIFFNSSQIAALNNIENPTIPVNNSGLTSENVDNLKYLFPARVHQENENDVKKISEYFSKKIFDRELSYADKVLLMSLKEDYLKELLHKLLELKEKMRMKKAVKFEEEENHDNEEVLNF